MLVCELWPSTPHAASVRSVKPSSPGRPTWYMTSPCRSSSMAARMRAAMSSSASSQPTRSHFPSPALADALEGMEDPVGVGKLRDGGRPFRTVASPRSGVFRVALELAHLERVAVHVREQPACRLAVEAGGGGPACSGVPRARATPSSPVRPSRSSAPSGGKAARWTRLAPGVEGLAAGLRSRLWRRRRGARGSSRSAGRRSSGPRPTADPRPAACRLLRPRPSAGSLVMTAAPTGPPARTRVRRRAGRPDPAARRPIAAAAPRGAAAPRTAPSTPRRNQRLKRPWGHLAFGKAGRGRWGGGMKTSPAIMRAWGRAGDCEGQQGPLR